MQFGCKPKGCGKIWELTLFRVLSNLNPIQGGVWNQPMQGVGGSKGPPLTQLPDDWERQTQKQIIVECKERMIGTGFTVFLPVFTGKTGKYR